MLIQDVPLTPALARWLQESHDDGEPELTVRRGGFGFRPLFFVLRADGSDVSDTEHIEITARLAAHAVEPLK